MMFAIHATAAFAGQGVPLTLAAAADFVFHGEVLGVTECMSADGTRPWSFVQFNVLQTIIGSGVPYTGEPANRFTLRVPAGTHTDGTRSAFVGLPEFGVGDRFVVPVHAHSGTPAVLPFFLFGDGGYFRTFTDAQGGAVFTGDGRLLQSTSVGDPLPGVRVPPARAVEPGWPYAGVDDGAVAAIVSDYRADVGYDGVNPPTGPWIGRLRLKSTLPVVVEDEGTFDTAGDCNARLEGEFDGTTLTLTGWCNAPKAGRVDITVQGTWSDGWSGVLRVAASFDPNCRGGVLLG